MIKKILASILLISSFNTLAETNIGTVNIQKALITSEISDESKKEFDAFIANYKEEIEYIKKTISDEKKKENSDIEIISINQGRLDFIINQIKNQEAKIVDALIQKNKQKIDNAIKSISKEHNIKIIIPDDMVIFSEPDVDITRMLSKELSK